MNTGTHLEDTTHKLNKKTGKMEEVTVVRKTNSTKMAETDDAYTLVSQYRHPMEGVYADYANSMKHLANQARIEETKAGKLAYN